MAARLERHAELAERRRAGGARRSARVPAAELPAGPRAPAIWQTLATWVRPTGALERHGRRYGRRFTTRLLGQPALVTISDPDEIRQVFQAPPDVLHPGEGARILEPIVGPSSVILLDEEGHLEQRRLLLPAFHGKRVERLAGAVEEVAAREMARWPRGQPIALHGRLQRLTLEIILRAVFGLAGGAELARLRYLLREILSFADNPLSLLPFSLRLFGGHGRVGALQRLGEEADALILQLIDERRREGSLGAGSARADVLALLLEARHGDGSAMSDGELRDELVTALVAGHETTASQLAWMFALLARAGWAAERLAQELRDDEDPPYLTACIQEAMRCRPVLPNSEPRLVKRPVEIGGVTYPPGVVLIANAHLVHHDPEIYEEPWRFRPERFMEQAPGTYTWLPFGGGRRRCLGSSFAILEMKVVARRLISSCRLTPVGPPERARRRSITVSPARGCELELTPRVG